VKAFPVTEAMAAFSASAGPDADWSADALSNPKTLPPAMATGEVTLKVPCTVSVRLLLRAMIWISSPPELKEA